VFDMQCLAALRCSGLGSLKLALPYTTLTGLTIPLSALQCPSGLTFQHFYPDDVATEWQLESPAASNGQQQRGNLMRGGSGNQYGYSKVPCSRGLNSKSPAHRR